MVDILQTGLEGSATLLAQYMAALLKIDPVMVLGNLETGFRPVLSFSGFGLMRVDRGFVAVSLKTIIDDTHTHTYKEYTFRTFFVDSSAMQAFFSLSST